MAAPKITKVSPHFSSPASISGDGSNYVLRYKVHFDLDQVRLASATDLQLLESRALIASSGGVSIPEYNSVHPFNNAARCSNISAQAQVEDNKPTLVIVTCTFTTKSNEQKDEEEDPLLKAPNVDWHVIFEREIVQNADLVKIFQGGQQRLSVNSPPNREQVANVNEFILPISNSADVPFKPSPEKDVPYLIANINRNIPSSSWDAKKALASIGGLNQDPFSLDGSSFDKEQGLIIDRRASIRYTANFSYREESISILFKNTHDIIVVDNGFTGYNEEAGIFGVREGEELVTFKTDGEDNPVETKMNGFGSPLPAGEDPVFLHFRYLKQINFGALNLPAEKL